MKLVSVKCPNCGAVLKADEDLKNATCNYCRASFLIDDEVKHIQLDGAEQAGYGFEKGRQRAQQEMVDDYAGTAPQEKWKDPRFWLWVAGWICIFPVPLMILLLRNNKMNQSIKIAVIVGAWAVYLLLIVAGYVMNKEKKKGLLSSSVDTGIETTIDTNQESDSDLFNTDEVVEEKDKDEEKEDIKEDDGVITPESISIKPDDKKLVLGETTNVSVKVSPEGASISDLEWKSSNKKVLKVDEDGVVTAVGGGSATITADISGDIKASCKIKVNGKNRKMRLSVSNFRKDNYNIGEQWVYDNRVNGKFAKGEYVLAVGKSLKLRSEYKEEDDIPEVGKAETTHVVTKKDLKKGFTVKMDLYVTENRGRYRGKKAHFLVMYSFSPA